MQTMINDNEKKNMFRYYVTQRPIDIGTIPNAKSAVNITRYEERKKLPGVDREVMDMWNIQPNFPKQRLRVMN